MVFFFKFALSYVNLVYIVVNTFSVCLCASFVINLLWSSVFLFQYIYLSFFILNLIWNLWMGGLVTLAHLYFIIVTELCEFNLRIIFYLPFTFLYGAPTSWALGLSLFSLVVIHCIYSLTFLISDITIYFKVVS